MMCILLGVAALANAEVQARSDDFATGKIPVEGSLSVNFASPRADTNIILYFSVTPLESGDVWTQFLLPENVVPIKNEVVEKKFPQVKAFETVTHTLKVRVLSEDRTIVRAVAAITGKEEDGIYISRGFETVLGGAEVKEPPPTHRGTSASGERLLIFESGEQQPPN